MQIYDPNFAKQQKEKPKDTDGLIEQIEKMKIPKENKWFRMPLSKLPRGKKK